MRAAAVYARVSTTGQAKDGTSLDTQVDACTEFARKHGFTVVQALREDASGATLNRAALDTVRGMADRREIQAVIIYDPDRLSRDLGHLMFLIEEFERNRTELLFVNAPTENTPEGMMLLQMRGMFAQYERAKIQERSRRGKERRAREGRVVASTLMAPYGYQFVQGEGRFEVLDNEARWVVKMFDWVVREHCSLGEVCRRLDSMGVPTKRGSVGWSRPAVRRILLNPAYTGTWYFNTSERVVPTKHRENVPPKHEKSTSTPRPRDQWIGVPIPALVGKEVQQEAARRLQINKENNMPTAKNDYLLRGFLKCGYCGIRLRARFVRTTRASYSQYACPGHRQPHRKDSCKTSYLTGHKIEQLIWGTLEEILSDKDRIMAVLEDREGERAQERKRDDAELCDVQNALQKIKAQENRILDAYGQDIISIDQLRDRMGGLKQEREALDKLRAEIEQRIARRDAVRLDTESLQQWVEAVQRGLKSPTLLTSEDKRDFMEALELKVTVFDCFVIVSGIIGSFPLPLDGDQDVNAIDAAFTSSHGDNLRIPFATRVNLDAA